MGNSIDDQVHSIPILPPTQVKSRPTSPPSYGAFLLVLVNFVGKAPTPLPVFIS